jgi:hypothetical protein
MYHGYWTRKKPIFMKYSLDKKSGVWNVSSLERERELAKYKWRYKRSGGTRMALNQQMCAFFYENGNKNQLETQFFVHKGKFY